MTTTTLKLPNKNGVSGQIVIPVSNTRQMLLLCGPERLELSYVAMDQVSIVKNGYGSDLKFYVDDEEINAAGSLYRHDINFVGLKVTNRESIIKLLSALKKAKKSFYIHENRGSTYVPYKIYLNQPSESIKKFSLACGLNE